MEFIPADRVMKCDMIYHVGTTFASNTLYFQPAGLVDEDTCGIAAGLLTSWWHDNLRPIQPAVVALDHVEVRDLTKENSFYSAQTITPNVGTFIGTILPMNCTLAVKFFTGLTGRSHRGRNYWVGLCESDVEGDFVIEGKRTLINATYAALVALLQAQSFSWVIVSRYHNKVRRTAAEISYVKGWSIESTVDSQRRRLAGRGK